MAYEYDYSKLRGRIVEKFGTLLNFSEHISISRVALSNKLSSATDISREDMEEWGNLLDIAPEDYHLYFFTKKV